MARPFSVLALWAAMALAVACSEDAYNGPCGAGDGCGAGANVGQGGAGCTDPEEVRCCPEGGQDCAAELLSCRPKEQCASTKCTSDAECPGPPDHRCGVGRCDEGACELEVWASKQIANQYPGDCKVNVCAPDGSVDVWTHPSDLPDDGNPCTWDICQGDQPSNAAVPDKSACPGGTEGVCVSGVCKECFDHLVADNCPPGLYCQYDKCVPAGCVNTEWDGQETGDNCGGPVCHPCGVGNFCDVGSDCTMGVCEKGKCKAPEHSDGVKNGDETGIDCGYPEQPSTPCNDGEGCLSAEGCKSSVCYLGICQVPTCTDATKNGTETGVDCGGEGCEPCMN